MKLSIVGDQFFTAVALTDFKKGICCFPGSLEDAKSCVTTGHTEAIIGVGLLKSDYDKAPQAASSNKFATPEIRLMNCPQTTEECGADKVVTIDGANKSVQIGLAGGSLTRDMSGCSWLIKSACKPFTIGYDATNSALIGGKTVE
jgi:hypothetical protein